MLQAASIEPAPPLRAAERPEAGAEGAPAPSPCVSIVTSVAFAAGIEATWRSLIFFEEIDARPPLWLRLLLPAPAGVEGSKAQVGDAARCLYAGGHLIKRVTRIDAGRSYAFDVVEQDLRLGGGIRLLGGGYELRDLGGGRTAVALTTTYAGGRRPRRLWKPIEALVGHGFHRYILGGMRRRAESPQG